jgi:acetate kinase
VRVLAVNAGSSTLKLTLLDADDRVLVARELDAPSGRVDADELSAVLGEGLGKADAVGHRIVHGGARFHEAVLIDRDVEAALRELVDLAPLHQPKSLAALEAVSAALPDVASVACFDTAFHATLPAAARTYALPAAWRERWGIRRYGFHGLSHAWVARRAPQLAARSGAALRIVSCHLGAGASLCAIAAGRSIDTTMGFTPLEGLVMATRSGTVDPGALLWLLAHSAMPEGKLAAALEHESGLLGLAGSADMREVLTRAAQGDERARLALDVYCHRLAAGISAMAASLGGIDVLVFTGGVGERSAEVRSRAVSRLAFLGLAIDRDRNARADDDAEISVAHANAGTLVIRSREDREIAREVRRVVAGVEARSDR